MITNIILRTLFNVVELITRPIVSFPDAALPANIANAVSTAGGYMEALSPTVPMTSILAIFGIFLTVEGAILIFKGINWVIRKIPTVN